MEESKIPHLTEFETKYRVDPYTLAEFKTIMDSIPNLNNYLYVEGPDSYYTNESLLEKFETFANTLPVQSKNALKDLIESTIGKFPPFMRYRKPSYGDSARKELTTKYKQDGSKNNIQREEKNIRVDNTDPNSLEGFIKDIGYELNFKIWKTCHIYIFNDATLVFYSVYDVTNEKSSKMDNFIEIEVNEETISTLTEDQAWEIIEKYEKLLENTGISARTRLKKSLYEMFRR